VSRLHANFVLNRGRATARDVLRLIGHVQRTAWDVRRIRLVPEVQLVGRWQPEEIASITWSEAAA